MSMDSYTLDQVLEELWAPKFVYKMYIYEHSLMLIAL